MPVSICQYRGAVGVFYFRISGQIKPLFLVINAKNTCKLDMALTVKFSILILLFFLIIKLLSKNRYHFKYKPLCHCFYILVLILYLNKIWLFGHLADLSNDIEKNPGPKSYKDQNLSICHWNLNSICAHNYIKVNLLRAYLSIHKFDIICLSETYLDSTIRSDDDNLSIPGYNFERRDHPSNIRRGGVGIYYKECLPLKILDITYLQECLNFEIKIGRKTCNFVCLYRSPSQNNDQFETFLENLNLNLDQILQKTPFVTLVLGDFNAKLNNWCNSDKNTFEGTKIESLMNQFCLKQVINEPTHILENSSSCIDLIFCSQSNLITKLGVHSSLHENCHHQIIFAELNLNICYPPPYEREVWYYNKAETDLIKAAISQFEWEKAFENTDANEKVSILNETILNIMRNYIPNEMKTFNDKDPPWITSEIKKMIIEKNTVSKKSKENPNKQIKVRSLQRQLKILLEKSKRRYFFNLSKKLTNPKTSAKAYWSILKGFLTNKKIPCIPPILHESKFITNFKEKPELFNSFFAKQCSILDTGSTLPPTLYRYTNNSVASVFYF